MSKRLLQIILMLSLALATIGSHAGDLLLSLTESGEMGRPELAWLKAEMPLRVQRRDMTVSTQVAVVRVMSGGVQARGGFDGTCSLVDAERFRDGTADRTANDATRELMKSAGALVRVADQQRLAPGFVAICLVSDRPQDFVSMLKLPAAGFVARVDGGMAYLVLSSGVFMFTL